ncbi:hypothetical protein BKA83DRAFT_4193608 [Pisolithus microcarpus]|nr:hypothetical protein BKA83DRAFT_4193608 [Pisolithus microcarpus]
MPALYPRELVAGSNPLQQVHFVLNSAAVAGLLGGEEAIASMAAVHVFGRKTWATWLVWYNSPGSYSMGIRFMRLARSASPAYDHGKVQTDLAALFEYNGWKGPKFTAVHSGTSMQDTSHIAALLKKECAELTTIAGEAEGRESRPVSVTIAKLGQPPEASAEVRSPVRYMTYFASVPVIISIVTCVLSAVYFDWYAFAIIIFGIIANGSGSMVLGSGKFLFSHPEPASGSPPGDGILDFDDGVVLLEGAEGAVNAVTRGRFFLLFESKYASTKLGICSMFLIAQSLAMLILISQSSFFGQLMFVISLAFSWAYNFWVWTHDKEAIQRQILKNILGDPVFTKFILKTRTSMLVFVALALKLKREEEIMRVFVIPSTDVWKKWKEIVIDRLTTGRELKFEDRDWNCNGFSEEQKILLETLLDDATVGYNLFKKHEDEIISPAVTVGK